MIFSNQRNDLRAQMIQAWQKYQEGLVCSDLEKQIVAVLLLHPEYHRYVTPEQIDRDFSVELGETNPFLHLSLHLGLREQLATNRPKSIVSLYERALSKLSDPHDVEHLFIEVLAECIWESQRHGTAIDDSTYLKRLKKHLKKANI